MRSVPGSTISITDGEITIDAELLAGKLGLSAALLKTEMRKGIVSSVAETGINEDVGRTRLTFRYGARAWTVVVDRGGNLVENIAPETLAHRLREHLQALATRRLPITYQEAAKALLLSPPNTIHQVTEALEQLMAEDAAASRPFIAAMVISKTRDGLPAPGFFDCAARLERFAGDATGPDARVFHAAEFNAAFAFWGPKQVQGG